ncbi:hypothetical protein [Bacillus sp. REN3]|nr:hypothetical protein [Bacillus sp. REN3]
MGKLIRKAIKWAPVVYPVVKKIIESRKTSRSKGYSK